MRSATVQGRGKEKGGVVTLRDRKERGGEGFLNREWEERDGLEKR